MSSARGPARLRAARFEAVGGSDGGGGRHDGGDCVSRRGFDRFGIRGFDQDDPARDVGGGASRLAELEARDYAVLDCNVHE